MYIFVRCTMLTAPAYMLYEVLNINEKLLVGLYTYCVLIYQSLI